jgi:hypothetical protein
MVVMVVRRWEEMKICSNGINKAVIGFHAVMNMLSNDAVMM